MAVGLTQNTHWKSRQHAQLCFCSVIAVPTVRDGNDVLATVENPLPCLMVLLRHVFPYILHVPRALTQTGFPLRCPTLAERCNPNKPLLAQEYCRSRPRPAFRNRGLQRRPRATLQGVAADAPAATQEALRLASPETVVTVAVAVSAPMVSLYIMSSVARDSRLCLASRADQAVVCP